LKIPKEQITAKRTTTYTKNKILHINVQSMSPTGTKDFTLRYKKNATRCMSPAGTKDFTLKYRVRAPHGQHNGYVKHKTMARSKALETEKRGNIYH
jgi:hypothetical protein